MEILAYIKELLLLNDCVVIPNFGGFIVNHKHASISGNIFMPPTSSISFNSKLNFNDGLLISHISAEEGINFISAKQQINAFVSELNYRLAEGEVVNIPQIGNIKYDEQHHLIFEPTKNCNVNINSYGLTSFSYPTLLSNKINSTIANHKNAIPISNTHKKINRKIFWATPVIIALMTIPISKNNQNIQKSNIINIDRYLNVEIPFDTKIANNEESNEHPINSPEENTSTPYLDHKVIKKYFVIVGSFRESTNADKLIADLNSKGFNAENLGIIKGLYYVSSNSFSTIDEAIEAKNTINLNHSEYKGTWIYKATN